MTQEEIINGSKLIAEYLGWQYIPFSADLKHKKAGWYQVRSAKPNIQKAKLRSKNTTTGEETVEELEIDVNFIKFNNKNGWTLVDDNYYKFICRNHSELRFWNSLDALVPVIQKIEKEEKAVFELRQNGCTMLKWNLRLKGGNSSFDLPNWSNNVFKVIVKYLETIKA
jgi:hypothetical protein